MEEEGKQASKGTSNLSDKEKSMKMTGLAKYKPLTLF